MLKINEGKYIMKLHKLLAVVSFLIALTIITPALAADSLYRFMHNDHDALVIGEVKTINGDTLVIDVEKSIISKRDLNINAIRKQLSIKSARITGVHGYSLFCKDIGEPGEMPKVGDYVLASLDKKGTSFAIAYGLYKVDGTDYKTLSVLFEENANDYVRMEAAAIKAFINSDGNLTEFSFNGSTGQVSSQQDGKVIYDSRKEE